MFNKIKSLIKSRNKRVLLALYTAPALAALSIVLVSVPMMRNGVRVQGINATANAPADVVIGQDDMTTRYINQVGYIKTLNSPNHIYSDGTKLFVADSSNNRVLIYNSIPAGNNASADIVIGQTYMTSVSANQGGSAKANTLNSVRSVYSDGTKLFIADSGNHRVLIYNSVPATNNASADVVIGQTDMTSVSANQGGSANANTLNTPRYVFSSGGKLFIADYNNQRVLIYNSIPTSNNASADNVIGQANMTSRSANQGGGPKAHTLYYAWSIYSDGIKLFIADFGNHRVLIYNSIPATNNASADVVVGQANMTSNSANKGGSVSANSLYYPINVYSSGIKLFIADVYNNRVLIFNSIPASNNASADIVIGQADMTHNASNEGGSVSASTLYYPYGVFNIGQKLLISDRGNNRVLIYNSVPTANHASADTVIGQHDMTHNGANQSDYCAANTQYGPRSAAKCGNKLIVSDYGNNRILIFNSVPDSNNTSADVVIGQPDMSSNTANNGGVSAKSLSTPRRVFSDGEKLFIADFYNHRVLIFNSIPEANYTEANIVIGQPNMTTNEVNYGGISAKSLYYPSAAYYDGSKLFIADYYNNRVLIYNNLPSTNYTAADLVIGQSDLSLNSENQGGSVSAKTLKNPIAVFSDGTRLFIADNGNARVLIYNSIPTSNNASADIVIGQPDMTSNSINQGLSSSAANTCRSPNGIYFHGNRLFISDYGNNRAMVYNTIPTSNNASADIVIGQQNMSSSSANQGGSVSSTTLYNPFDVWGDGSKIYISDSVNNRVLIYNLTTTKPVISEVKFNDVEYKPGDTINSLPILKATLTDTGGVGGIYINNLKITIDSALYTYASFDASTDSYDSTTGLMTFKTKTALSKGTHSFKIEISDYLGNWETWEATDLAVKAATDVEVEGTPLSYPSYFKPSVQSTNLTYTLTTDHDISVYIFNMQGRLVWKKDYQSGTMGGKAGYNAVAWDGKDDFGEAQGNGVYLFRIVSQGKVIGKGKIAVVE